MSHREMGGPHLDEGSLRVFGLKVSVGFDLSAFSTMLLQRGRSSVTLS